MGFFSPFVRRKKFHKKSVNWIRGRQIGTETSYAKHLILKLNFKSFETICSVLYFVWKAFLNNTNSRVRHSRKYLTFPFLISLSWEWTVKYWPFCASYNENNLYLHSLTQLRYTCLGSILPPPRITVNLRGLPVLSFSYRRVAIRGRHMQLYKYFVQAGGATFTSSYVVHDCTNHEKVVDLRMLSLMQAITSFESK
jgi:hypothetical protein